MRALRITAALLAFFATALAFSASGPSTESRKTLLLLSAGDEVAENTSAADFRSKWRVDDTYTTTDSGLMFKDAAVGSGESPGEGGTISINYSMWFDDFSRDAYNDFSRNAEEGTKYFSTQGQPMSLQFGKRAKILKGWSEGMRTMKPGGRRTLIIPPDLGYGAEGLPRRGDFPKIPGNAHLRFEVEMVSVDNSIVTKLRFGAKPWWEKDGKFIS